MAASAQAALELIGVPFDGFGRAGHQRGAAGVLRSLGLERAFSNRATYVDDGLRLPRGDPDRDPHSGLMNERALLAMVSAVGDRVSKALAAQHFPIVYGADCSVLLGAVPALRDVCGKCGLVFVDGHEDTTPLDVSPDGEAANMELGLLLGITGRLAPAALRERLPALDPTVTAVIGPRDDQLRRQYNVASLADAGVYLRRADTVTADPSGAARGAVDYVQQNASGWWLHLDLDVLAQSAFPAGAVPGTRDEQGGLDWEQLTDLTIAALDIGGCAGFSLVIYDPDLDPDRNHGRRIVQFLSALAGGIP